jgi:hypothetical protein
MYRWIFQSFTCNTKENQSAGSKFFFYFKNRRSIHFVYTFFYAINLGEVDGKKRRIPEFM